MGYKISETEPKKQARKKIITLKNINVSTLRLVDAESGEDFSEEVIAEIPCDSIDFKLTFELPDEE